ncbi:MAG: 50S ribosomal protein L25 [Treponema sp.]|nr:50S ribosomal protein L25 [Treponema sp.]
MSQVVLCAKNREGAGSSQARRIRRAGRIPGVLYGKSGKAISIDLDALEFTRGVRNISESTIVKVDIDGKSVDAFVKATQRNILDGTITHVDFYEVKSDVVVRARVSIHLIGNPVGVRDGGMLETPLHDIEVECLPKDLPERIEVDITELKANQSMHVRDITLSENIKLLSNPDRVIALVKFAKIEVVTPTEAELAAAAAAAAAAGTPGAPGAAPGTPGAAAAPGAPGAAPGAPGAAPAAGAAPAGKSGGSGGKEKK